MEQCFHLDSTNMVNWDWMTTPYPPLSHNFLTYPFYLFQVEMIQLLQFLVSISLRKDSKSPILWVNSISENGTVYTYGANFYSQLGIGSQDSVYSVMVAQIPTAVSCSMGGYHGLAITSIFLSILDFQIDWQKATGTVYSWGSNYYGELGLGDINHHTMPQQVPGLTGVKLVQACEFFSLAVTGLVNYFSGAELNQTSE